MKGTAAAFADYETLRLDLSRRLLEVTDDIASYAWTDDELQQLHRAFSGEMSREVRALAALQPSFGDAGAKTFTDAGNSACVAQ